MEDEFIAKARFERSKIRNYLSTLQPEIASRSAIAKTAQGLFKNSTFHKYTKLDSEHAGALKIGKVLAYNDLWDI